MARFSLIAREGITAGGLGAASVALWFLIIDSVAGHPLRTPELLGRAFFHAFGVLGSGTAWIVVVGYTVLHVAVFIAFGCLVSQLLSYAKREPAILGGALILFLALEGGFISIVAVLDHDLLGVIAWYQILAGNLIASLVMGRYLFQKHPEVSGELSDVLAGRV